MKASKQLEKQIEKGYMGNLEYENDNGVKTPVYNEKVLKRINKLAKLGMNVEHYDYCLFLTRKQYRQKQKQEREIKNNIDLAYLGRVQNGNGSAACFDVEKLSFTEQTICKDIYNENIFSQCWLVTKEEFQKLNK